MTIGQRCQGKALGPRISRENRLRILMDKFPSLEVLSLYSYPLLPTSCQQRRGPLRKRDKRTAMRRADRLFQIIQVLRRTRKPLTADAIAAELETSKRTIYRDIATLIEQRVPIRGEAGMGYILEKGFDMPPLMLTPDEIEAARARRAMGGRPRRCGAGPRRRRT